MPASGLSERSRKTTLNRAFSEATRRSQDSARAHPGTSGDTIDGGDGRLVELANYASAWCPTQPNSSIRSFWVSGAESLGRGSEVGARTEATTSASDNHDANVIVGLELVGSGDHLIVEIA